MVRTFLKTIVFNPIAPEHVILRMLDSFQMVAVLILERVSCVTDELVVQVFKRSAQLKYLSLAYCKNIGGIDCLAQKPSCTVVSIHGCWQIVEPHQSISATSVVEIQLLALQSASAKGVEKMLSFVSTLSLESLKGLFDLTNLSPSYQSLVYNQGFSIQNISELESQSSLLVTVLLSEKADSKQYMWRLCREGKSFTSRNWLTVTIDLVDNDIFL